MPTVSVVIVTAFSAVVAWVQALAAGGTVSGPLTRSYYRIAKIWPPGDREYRTNQEKKGDPDPAWSEERQSA